MKLRPEILDVVQSLARYLRANPHACDTVEGIARWWFTPDAQPDEKKLETALRWLIVEGLVEALQAADGRVRYRRLSASEDEDGALDAVAHPVGRVRRKLH